jgi:cytochrome c peroxidase
MAFFMDFTHRPNPKVLDAHAFSPVEKHGAEVFARRCESCHEARLSTDEPSTRQPFLRWEALVFSREDPMVWASTAYQKTGVLPYVHELGARPPSLRRLYKKWPYFTNGSAKSVRAVLDRARFQAASFWHDGAPPDAAGLAADEVEALEAFLDLL